MARQVEELEEAPVANPVLQSLWVSKVLTPLAEATEALNTPTDEKLHYALNEVQSAALFIWDIADGYESAGNQLLAEKLRRSGDDVAGHSRAILTHIEGALPFETIQWSMGSSTESLVETGHLLT